MSGRSETLLEARNITPAPPGADDEESGEEVEERIWRFLDTCRAGPPSDKSEQLPPRDNSEGQDDQMTLFPSHASLSTSPSRSLDSSVEYCREVLEPRGITIMARPHATTTPQQLPAPSALEEALGQALVTFPSARLAETCRYAKGEFNEAQWTEDVYLMYFLLTNPVSNQGGVRRVAQHRFSWSGKVPNVCLPPVMDVDRRSSGLFKYSQIRATPTDQRSQSDSTSWPDHSYFILPDRATQAQLINYSSLPAFRGGLSYNSFITSGPPYFITEERPLAGLEREARQYLALIAAFLLQERLLLRHLTDTAQDESQVGIDDSLCVYAMTNCGPVSTIYKMSIRNECPNVRQHTKVKTAVRFDLHQLCAIDLTSEACCEQLKVWVNYIHYWGKTVHFPAVMAEGLEASQSKYCYSGNWMDTLARRAFYYSATGLGFTTLRCNYLTSLARST